MKFDIAGWETGNRNTWQPEDIKANIDFVAGSTRSSPMRESWWVKRAWADRSR